MLSSGLAQEHEMPRYDYTCQTNGRTLEASHRMGEQISTWGELCEAAVVEPGGTPLDAPVVKLISTGTRIESASDSRGISLPTSCGCGKMHGCGGH